MVSVRIGFMKEHWDTHLKASNSPRRSLGKITRYRAGGVFGNRTAAGAVKATAAKVRSYFPEFNYAMYFTPEKRWRRTPSVSDIERMPMNRASSNIQHPVVRPLPAEAVGGIEVFRLRRRWYLVRPVP